VAIQVLTTDELVIRLCLDFFFLLY